MTFTIAASPTTIAAGTQPGLQVPAAVIGANGITDDGGRPWDLGASPDVLFGWPD
jgi:hypothetical protein